MTRAKDATVEEIMAVAISHLLEDDDVAFVGLGTGKRAFVLAVGVPTAACKLAQLTHAPGLVLMLGPIVNPRPDVLPESYTDRNLASWMAEAQIPVWECLDVFKRGKMTVSFVSGSQIDRHGNLNVVAIGDHRKPKVRLTGCIAQTDHTMAKRNIVMMDLEKRRFVEKVDNISYVGYLDGKTTRAEKGIRGGGPQKVVTNMAIFAFDPITKEMLVESLHPGVTFEDVAANVSFELRRPGEIRVTEVPTVEELELLRRKVDPKRLLLGGGMH